MKTKLIQLIHDAYAKFDRKSSKIRECTNNPAAYDVLVDMVLRVHEVDEKLFAIRDKFNANATNAVDTEFLLECTASQVDLVYDLVLSDLKCYVSNAKLLKDGYRFVANDLIVTNEQM